MADHNLRDNVALLAALQPVATTPPQPLLPSSTTPGHQLQQSRHQCGSLSLSPPPQPLLPTNTDLHDSCVLVATTHILFNNKRGDVKLGQARTILCRSGLEPRAAVHCLCGHYVLDQKR
jgi:hypothetical protein